MHATSLRLPEDIGKRLEALARRTGRSKTFYILEAIREHLDELEDIYIAEKRLADIRAGRTRVISAAEMEARLDLDD